MTTDQDTINAAELLKQRGTELGFQHVGIAAAVTPPGFHPLLDWIDGGYAADMNWIERRRDAYQHPDGVLPGTRSVIVAALNYHNRDPLPNTARIARYAWSGQNYHKVLHHRLKQLTQILHTTAPESRSRIVVDTAPLLERDFARLAGIGWFGKNTMLISREIGSWFFLGAILTTAQLTYDNPYSEDYCGTCTRCLDACPTDAFPEAYVLNSQRCISYHTIENRSEEIPEDLTANFGNWVFGCDICQEVCPHNQPTRRTRSLPVLDAYAERRDGFDLLEVLGWQEQDRREAFVTSSLKRAKLAMFKRNALICAGNLLKTREDEALRRRVEAIALDTDEDSLVRETAREVIKRFGV